jgi:GTP-binding protein SAR1
MKTLLLTHFDCTFGPKIFLKAPETVNVNDFKHIPPLMDLYKEGFFYHEFNKDKSANLNIQVSSRYARGNFELLMISYLVRDGQLNPGTAKEHLEKFADQLKQIDDAYKAFYIESSKHSGDARKFEEVKELFDAFYASIPAEINMFQTKQAKIFVFGITKAGKTTILQALQNQTFKDNKPNTFIDVSKILIPNTDVSVMVYDAPGQIKYREMWIPNLAGQNGLVFVVDVADKERFSEAKIVLHEIVTRPETNQLPLLLLFNKIDLKKPKVNQLVKELQLEALGNRPMKYFETSAMTGEGIVEAFRWFADKLSKRN